jgi:hypothetical protein
MNGSSNDGVGTRRMVHLGAVSFPGIQISPAVLTTVETARGSIRALFAEVMTLRTPNPNGANKDGAPYLTVTPENLRFATLRFDSVPGLDFDPETGEAYTLEQLETIRAKQIVARQQQLASASAPAAVTVDLDALASEGASA